MNVFQSSRSFSYIAAIPINVSRGFQLRRRDYFAKCELIPMGLEHWMGPGLGKPRAEEFRSEGKAGSRSTETDGVRAGTAVCAGDRAVPSPSSRLLSQEVS